MPETGSNKKTTRKRPNCNGEEVQPLPPLLVEGNYEAYCFKTETAKYHLGIRKAYIWFRLMGGPHEGAEVFMACNYPYGKKSFGLRICQQWMFAQGRRFKKGENITLKSFEKRLYLVNVRTVFGKFADGQPKPDFMNYSVVNRIVEPLTGGVSL